MQATDRESLLKIMKMPI